MVRHYKFYIILALSITQILILVEGGEGEGESWLNKNVLGQTTMDTSTTAINSSNSNPNLLAQREVTVNYFARFNCGSIDDDSGPLRPGKYDSDITIFNKKEFPITVIWKAIAVDQQYKSNFNILNIPPESIVNINCAKIFPFSHTNPDNVANSTIKSINNIPNSFTEGIVKIEITISDGLLVNNFLNNQIGNMVINSSEIDDLVNVDVLHTVNTLDDLNKEALYLIADFSIRSNDEKRTDNLTAVFDIKPNEITNPLNLIKNKLDSELGKDTNSTIDESRILISKTKIISSTYTDNHALTVQRVEPIIS
ncbi:hypothetical protein [Candidatus Nitrosocosmicus franklandus]|uniref:Uncharacterized protein n=1 Tax=Candidatus Nitrosocosmicus franklandianus TaxID=1798806 RepID=A0A484IBG4_9ARCH|nr:hypothetical protein [Candidatus Nitrosocosmicus franklandus]VFJ14125.1 conserved protein of unknown function [Candidatus Nitrosocosmicus franklandus]